eukprot:m.149842 g.149842  ORF g.149842 m.149842 type:complete len:107 (+) comp52785_c3_seq14:204-524(+)
MLPRQVKPATTGNRQRTVKRAMHHFARNLKRPVHQSFFSAAQRDEKFSADKLPLNNNLDIATLAVWPLDRDWRCRAGESPLMFYFEAQEKAPPAVPVTTHPSLPLQ